MPRSAMTPIGDILTKALRQFRPSQDTEMTRLWSLWDQAVGEAIAENAKPAMFREGVLVVHVASSVWMQQLRFQIQTMKTSLNLALGKELVKEIRFKIASLNN